MRLTNVTHLRLPFGRLVGYDVTVGRPLGDVPVSFDQARHVGAGDRRGSWMALSFELTGRVELDALEAAWLRVIARHRTLRTVFTPGEEPGSPALQEVEVGAGGWVEHPIDAGQAVNAALRDVLDARCRPFAAPSHRLCVLQTAATTTVVIGADHAHVDMWSMLVIARDLLSHLAGHTPVGDAAPFSAHTAALQDRAPAPGEVRHRWAEVLEASGGVMPRFPLPLGDVSRPQRERVEVRDVFDVDAAAAFGVRARAAGVSQLALVVSAMTVVTRDLAQAPLRAVFPVHSRYDATWHDSVGWFITNAVLESADAEPTASADAVREAVGLGSWPLADVLEPWGGMPEAPGMFAISWLDLGRLPVRLDSVGLQAQYVGAEVLTDGVMLWFVLDEGGLHLRCRYPDTVEARRHVGRWLDELVARLRAQAQEAAGGEFTARGRRFRIGRAARGDVPDLVALLADDPIGSAREDADDIARYERAFDAVTVDPSQYLAAVRDDSGQLVATMQLSIVPGLSRAGSTRLTIEAVRVAPHLRGQGVGAAMLAWAHDHGRARGASLAQLATDLARDRAHTFYARLGYEHTHAGFKRTL